MTAESLHSPAIEGEWRVPEQTTQPQDLRALWPSCWLPETSAGRDTSELGTPPGAPSPLPVSGII
jgi:hypothetical protein